MFDVENEADKPQEQDALAELAKGEFDTNDKQKRLMEYIAANINVQDFLNCLSEEMWLREVLKDVQSKKPLVRMNALKLWGQHMGYLGAKKSKGTAVGEVEFQ